MRDVTSGDDLRPRCPECDAPFRDIEVTHIENQRGLARSGSDPFKHQLVLFCGHRVEVTVERFSVTFRAIP